MAGLYFTQFNPADELQQVLIASLGSVSVFLLFFAEPRQLPTSDCGLKPAQSADLFIAPRCVINVQQSVTVVDG